MAEPCEIYAALMALGGQVVLPGGWRSLSKTSFFRLPLENSSFVDQLQARFCVEDLLAARVLERQHDGEVVLSRLLRQHGEYVLAARRDAEEPPFALVTAGGVLGMELLPALCMLDDYRLLTWMRAECQLIIVETFPEAAILWGLGLAVVPAMGLQDLRGAALRRFATALVVPPPGTGAAENPATSPATASTDTPASPAPAGAGVTPAKAATGQESADPLAALLQPYYLRAAKPSAPPPPRQVEVVLARFRLTDLTVGDSPSLDAVARHFANLTEAGLGTWSTFEWLPTPSTLQHLATHIQFGDADQIYDFMQKRAGFEALEIEALALPQGFPGDVLSPLALAEARPSAGQPNRKPAARVSGASWSLADGPGARAPRRELLQQAFHRTYALLEKQQRYLEDSPSPNMGRNGQSVADVVRLLEQLTRLHAALSSHRTRRKPPRLPRPSRSGRQKEPKPTEDPC